MRKPIILVLGLAILFFGGFEIYSLLTNKKEVVDPIVSNSLPTSTVPTVAEKQMPKYQGQALRAIGDDPTIKSLTPEILAAKKAELGKFAEIAEKNPSDTLAWLKISEIKKFFNNYRGAVDALEYLKLLAPNDFIAHLNLGNLYGFYLNDFVKAERNFQAAINNSSGHELAAAALSLADLYKDFYKEKYDQVDDVLLLGIQEVPEDLNLVLKLAFYYKEINDKANAIKYFEQLLLMPGLSGTHQKAIEDEVAALKN